MWIGFGELSFAIDLDRIGIGMGATYLRNGGFCKDEFTAWVCFGPFTLESIVVMPWQTSGRGHL